MRTSIRHISLAAAATLLHATLPSIAAGAEYLKCGEMNHLYPSNPIPLHSTSTHFPADDPFTIALGQVFQGWSSTASNMQYQHIQDAPSNSADMVGNYVNEVFWSDGGSESDSGTAWVGLCVQEVQEANCLVLETDVIFNDSYVNFTASTHVADVPVHAGDEGSTYSFQAVAFHEFGHAQGLAHTPDTYSVMGLPPHHHVNGDDAIAYPGEDAVMGSIGLYGSIPGGFTDLALASFKRTGVDGGYAVHSPNDLEHVANGPGVNEVSDIFQVAAGSQIKMETTVENMGTSPESTTIGYYLSTDSNITTTDTYLGEYALDVYPDKPTVVKSPTLNLPDNLVVGDDYWLGAVIDPTQALVEDNEWNNRTYIRFQVTLWKPDLKADSIAGPNHALIGLNNAFISSYFSNVGGVLPAATSFEIQLVDPADPAPDALSGITVATLNNVQPGYHPAFVEIPYSVPPGDYHWALKVATAIGGEEGSGNDLEESNFVLGNTVTIEAGLTELVAASVSGPAYGGDAFGVEAGDPIEVSCSIENLGVAPALPYVYHIVLSLNDDIAVSDWIVASGETTSTGDFDVIGTFPALPHGGSYKWGLIITNTGFGDDPSNNTLLGGEIVVSMDSEIGDGPGATDEFVSGPSMVVLNTTASVSFQIPFVLANAYDYQVVLMTAEQVAGTSKTSPIVLSRTIPYASGIIEIDVSAKSKSVAAGNYYWGVVLPDPSPWVKTPFKVVVGNAVKVFSSEIGK